MLSPRVLQLAALACGLLALLACSPATPRPSPASAAPGAQPTAPAAAEWEQQWQTVLKAGQQEGVVVVAGYPSDQTRLAITQQFEQQYGIKVDYQGLSPAQASQKILTERAAGQYLWDVVLAGTTSIVTTYKPVDALDPIEPALILPEVKDPGNWRNGLPYFDAQKLGLAMTPYASPAFIYNPTLVNPQEFDSYQDLLDPRWKGQLVARDPGVAGGGQAMFSFFYLQKDLGPKYIQGLLDQELVLSRDIQQPLDLVAQGKAAICIGCDPALVPTMREKGLSIGIVPPRQMKEGSYVTTGAGGVTLVNRAPHPNAAKVYVNWLLSQEGQVALGTALGLPSARKDVANDWVEPWLSDTDGLYFAYSEDALAESRTVAVPALAQMFSR
jgi:iron(III) transport system substrate-binding protein